MLSLFSKKKTTPNKPKQFDIDINGQNVPVKIYFERRKNDRVSITKNGIIIRMSIYASKEHTKTQLAKFLDWARVKYVQHQPRFAAQNQTRNYNNGGILTVGETEFTIHIEHKAKASSSAKLKDKQIHLSLSNQLSEKAEAETKSTLVCRSVAQYFTPIISEELHRLNNRYNFGTIKNVRLKNNSSNWGSCSSKGNINISTRLLFAPQDVIEYVLVHELCHLKVPNHSSKFWNLVASVLPNYKVQEKWLKEFGHQCYL